MTESFNKMHESMENILRASNNLHSKNVALSKQVADLQTKLNSANAELQRREQEDDAKLSQVAQRAEDNEIGLGEAVSLVEDSDQTVTKEGEDDNDVIPPTLHSPK